MRPATAGLFILTAATTIALCLLLSAQTPASTPQALVTRFYTFCVKHHVAGLPLDGGEKEALGPLLSQDLRRRIDDAEACQADSMRQHPELPLGKPPFVDCCIFTSTPDGPPTSFTLGPTSELRDGRYEVLVSLFLNDNMGGIRWRDAAIVKREGDRFVIDNVVFDSDEKPVGYLPAPMSFWGCQGPQWVGGK
jgi:hypothetical protein